MAIDFTDEDDQLVEQYVAAVLHRFELRTDAKIFRFPDRYTDPRGDLTDWGIKETSASFEAASTPRSHPTAEGVARREPASHS